MKRTKNMYYRETPDAEELYLYSINDNYCYTRFIQPVLRNLERYVNKGTYNIDKAVDGFYYVATNCSLRYDKELGGKFDVTDRFTAAVKMEECFRDQVMGLE